MVSKSDSLQVQSFSKPRSRFLLTLRSFIYLFFPCWLTPVSRFKEEVFKEKISFIADPKGKVIQFLANFHFLITWIQLQSRLFQRTGILKKPWSVHRSKFVKTLCFFKHLIFRNGPKTNLESCNLTPVQITFS